MKNKFVALAVAILAVSLTACDYQANNKIKQKDAREGDAYVYGVHPDSAAVQTKKKYADDPKAIARAGKIREKLFGVTK